MAGTITATTTARKGRGIVRVDCSLLQASGAISAQGIGAFYGRLVGVLIDPAAGAGGTFLTTADLLITDATTGAPILSDLSFGGSAGFYRPTAAVVDNAGAAITPATTANDVNRDIFVAGNINLATANGNANSTDTALVSLIFDEG